MVGSPSWLPPLASKNRMPPTLKEKLAVSSKNSRSLFSELGGGQRARKKPILWKSKAQALTYCLLVWPGTGQGTGIDVTLATTVTSSHSFPSVNDSSSRPGLSCPQSRQQCKFRDNGDDSLSPALDVFLLHQPYPPCPLSPTSSGKSSGNSRQADLCLP